MSNGPRFAGRRKARDARVTAIRDLMHEAAYDADDTLPERIHRRQWLAHHLATEIADRTEETVVDLGETAYMYAVIGWHVFPLRARAKTPANANGFKGATNDTGRIAGWWAKHPDHNVGVATGASRLLVVDLDTGGEGHCATAFGALMALADQYEDDPLPATYEVLTPSGGEHHYFRVPDDVELPPCSAGRIAPHVDIRSEGGYVVAEGSVTDDGLYTCGRDETVALAPLWLVELCRKPPAPEVPMGNWVFSRDRYDPYVASAIQGECLDVATAPEGQRNHQLNVAAFRLGQLVGGGLLDAGDAFDALFVAATRHGLGSTETERTIKSGLAAGLREPRRPDD